MIDLGQLTRRAFALDSAFRPLVDDLLRLLSEALQAHQESGDLEVMAALDEHRRRLLEGRTDQDIEAFVESCTAAARAAVTRARERQIDQHAELARCVTQIRDTLRLLAGDADKPTSEIDGAADRFTELLAMEDFGQLKAKLAQEVVQLRQVAEERRQQWHDATEMFASRVSVLETQLAGVREEASLDPLTRVGSRRFFEATLAERIQVSMRQFAVAVFDLDEFKAINDTHGHQAGDRVLQEVAGSLKEAMRPGDVVARLGGDEFVAIMVGVTLRQAELRLQDVVAAIAGRCATVEGLPNTSVSCGVAECSAGDTAESLIARADRALYDAKKKGKNRVAGRAVPFIRDLLKV
jgi:diguanylate cyclase (GGDEF)-like protein